MRRIDLGVYATALIAASSFLPWLDSKWISTSCAHDGAGGAVSVAGVVGWLTGAALLTYSLVRARRDRRIWRALLLVPVLLASFFGFVLLVDLAFARDCGGMLLG